MIKKLVLGSGSLSWVFWVLAIGGLLYLFLPRGDTGMIGILTGVFAAIKIEGNALRERVAVLEAGQTG